jgi:hypothetical protein
MYRYEKMFLSGATTIVSFLVSWHFFETAVAASAQQPLSQSFWTSQLSLSLTCLGAAALFFGFYFAGAGVIQTYVPGMSRYRPIYVAVRRAAQVSMVLTCISAAAFTVVHAFFALR